MFDLGWTELLVIGIVALIVVGPKDLPVLFRNVGRFVGKAKGMAREFSSAMNQAADETGMKEVASGLKAATNPLNAAVDSVKDVAKSFDFDPESETGKLAKKRKAESDELKAKAKERKAAVAAANKAAENMPDFVKQDAPAAGSQTKTTQAVTSKKTKPAAAKKTTPKKPVAKGKAASSASAKQAIGKKPTTRKPAVKKPAARKPAPKKAAPKDKA